jgi:hypothetical protein
VEESGGGKIWFGERGWRSKVGVGSHGRGLWRFISKGWHNFSNHIRLIPGDGSKISFWGEAWCSSVPLLEVYQGLYNLVSNKEAFIADNYDLISGTHQWNISFVRSLNDWEVEELASLYSLLYSFNLDGGDDKMWWVPNRKGKFEVKSFYFILNSAVSFPFPWRAYGVLKPLRGWHFLCGQLLLAKSSPWTI